MLFTSQNGIQKAYWFEEGYIRTSSCFYTLKNLQNRMIHLTNDAIQKKSDDYGKFEGGNKISYKEFNKYLQQNYPSQDLYRDFVPQMKKIARHAVLAGYGSVDNNKKDNSFEIFGLDYMIDEQFKIYLIEVNTNPCFEISSTLIARLIPNMIENVLRIAVDPVFPPPDYQKWSGSKKEYIPDNLLQNNRFELFFDELVDATHLEQNLNKKKDINQKIIYDIDELSEQETSDQD